VLSKQFGKAVNGRAKQLRVRVLKAVEHRVSIRSFEPERAGDVHDARGASSELRHPLQRGLRGRGEEDHGALGGSALAFLERRIAQLAGPPQDSQAAGGAVVIPPVAGQQAQLGPRMIGQDAGQLNSGIAGCPDDGDGRFMHLLHVYATGTIGARGLKAKGSPCLPPPPDLRCPAGRACRRAPQPARAPSSLEGNGNTAPASSAGNWRPDWYRGRRTAPPALRSGCSRALP